MARIIYTNSEGGVAILVPALDSGLSLEQIAAKDVPVGVPYKIVDTDQIPTDRTFREAWEADMTDPHGTGADYGAGSHNVVVAWNEDGTPVLKGVPQ